MLQLPGDELDGPGKKIIVFPWTLSRLLIQRICKTYVTFELVTDGFGVRSFLNQT